MKLYCILAFVILIAALSQSAEIGIRNYNNFKVLRVQLKDDLQYQLVVDLFNQGTFDFWAGPSRNAGADIMVDPLQEIELISYFEKNGIQFRAFIEDVGALVKNEGGINLLSSTAQMNWDNYQGLDTIYAWLDDLVATYSDLVSIETIGQSTEGRDLKVLKISKSNTGTKKIAFWMDATIHAREWISTSTITYIINELVTKSHEYSELLDVLDFYVLPVVNPDGYHYSHTVDRMWRKTRSNHNSNKGCMGVDANRNFGFHWGEIGSSNDKCSETYRGPKKYSEPEALALRNYIENLKPSVNWDTFLTLHSYSQLWMTPWGYTDDLTADYNELKSLGEAAVKELGSHYGTSYRVGNAADILYYSSGSSRDWAKGEGGFKYVYTIELRDKGDYGFILPKEQIIPTAKETWAGIQVVAKNYLKN